MSNASRKRRRAATSIWTEAAREDTALRTAVRPTVGAPTVNAPNHMSVRPNVRPSVTDRAARRLAVGDHAVVHADGVQGPNLPHGRDGRYRYVPAFTRGSYDPAQPRPVVPFVGWHGSEPVRRAARTP